MTRRRYSLAVLAAIHRADVEAATWAAELDGVQFSWLPRREAQS